jgi:hypothetical protein
MENLKKRKNLFIITTLISDFLKSEFIGQHRHDYNAFLFTSYDQCSKIKGIIPDIVTLDDSNKDSFPMSIILELKSIWNQAQIIYISPSDDRLVTGKLLSSNNKTDIYHTMEIASKTSSHIYIQ